LDAEAPLRIPQAVLDARRVSLRRRAVHRLEKKASERKMGVTLRRRVGLWKHQLEFVACDHRQFRRGLWLTQIQSMPGGSASVPFVSTAIWKSRWCKARVSCSST